MKYYIIAGEASGDLHASNLIKRLIKRDSKAQIRGWGGDLMREAGCVIVRHYKDTAIMGFMTVLSNIGKIHRNLADCNADIMSWCPDVVIFVDYGGFNLRLARMLRKSGIKLFYYISPKIWAWNTGRVKKIKKLIDQMYVIFPFEVDFYSKYGYTAKYGGNPLVDVIEEREQKMETFDEFVAANGLSGKPLIALLAGSRVQELKHVLPKMLRMVKYYSDYEFVIAGAPSMTDSDYETYTFGTGVRILYGQTYRLLRQARAALVTSGTATLETALLRTPQVVCYSGEGGVVSYLLFKIFVKVRFISLVNLIAGREVVKELLMQQLNERNLLRELSAILHDGSARLQILQGYDEVIQKMGCIGASDRFASMIISDLTL